MQTENRSSHPLLRNLLFYLLPDSSTSIVFRTRAIVSVVYSIVFSAKPVKPDEWCVAPRKPYRKVTKLPEIKIVANPGFS